MSAKRKTVVKGSSEAEGQGRKSNASAGKHKSPRLDISEDAKDETDDVQEDYENEDMSLEDEYSDDDESGQAERPVDQVAFGIDTGDLEDAEGLEQMLAETGFNFACLDFDSNSHIFDELTLTDGQLVTNIVGRISSLPTGAQELQDFFLNTYSLGAHLGLQAILLSLDWADDKSVRERSHVLADVLDRFPLTAPQLWCTVTPQQWQSWNTLRFLLDHHDRLFVCLDVSACSSQELSTMSWSQWEAEPVKAILLHPSQIPPVLESQSAKRKRQEVSSGVIDVNVGRLLDVFCRSALHLILQSSAVESKGKQQRKPKAEPTNSLESAVSSKELIETWHEEWSMQPFSSDPALQSAYSLEAQFNFPFRDRLQTPLDPLQVNLDLETYRVMEEDPVKYARYEQALIASLKQWKEGNHSSGNGKKTSAPLVAQVLVVGPGRGALIESSLLAAAMLQIRVQVTAVEKNRNAVRTLQHRFRSRLDDVRIIEGDVRTMVATMPKGQYQVIVSELLGSFGDNEASPECLTLLEGLLHPTNGFMIPGRYQSFLQAISAPHLWQQARHMFSHEHSKCGFDYPYVVRLHRIQRHGEPIRAFEFVHERSPTESIGDAEIRLQRQGNQQVSLTLVAAETVTVHGFAGYFEADLFGELAFSTVPEEQTEHPISTRHSPGMFSWFPMFVPLRQPLTLSAGQRLEVVFWRRVSLSDRRMWYEWQQLQPFPSPLQNLRGRSFHVSL